MGTEWKGQHRSKEKSEGAAEWAEINVSFPL